MIDHLGKYEIIRSLGNGAMGEVFLAHHPVIGREVAIKTILPGVAKGEDAEARFRREAAAAGQLNHPNLVTIYDFDKDQGILYLVMEYVKGDDLEDLIRERGLSQSQFLEVLAQVCDGLGYAHRNGIIHRDVKPANVRVVRDGKRIQAKVMDFGIARMEDSNMTSTGIVMGTVSYMAPEYIQSGKASNLTDLFAVGVMLYEALTGTKPFAGDNTTTVLFKIVSENPRPIDLESIQGISPSVRDILDRTLAKDPARRYPSAEELARALRACKDPSWTGTLDEFTAVLERKQAEITAATQVDGTVMLDSQATAMVPAQPGTMLIPPVVAPPVVVSQVPPKGRTGLYAGVAVVVLALAGAGAWMGLRKPKSAAETPGAAAVPPPQGAPAQATTPSLSPEPGSQVKTQVSAQVQVPREQPQQTADPAGVKPQVQAEPPKAAPPVQTPPKVEESPEARMSRAMGLLSSDPRQAAAILRPLAYAKPDDPQLQGNYLAALYHARQTAEFERVMGAARTRGMGGLRLMGASPAFKHACGEERAAQKARNGTSLWEPLAFVRLLGMQ
nr:protein kinase [uncultured Holophaga sp.]